MATKIYIYGVATLIFLVLVYQWHYSAINELTGNIIKLEYVNKKSKITIENLEINITRLQSELESCEFEKETWEFNDEDNTDSNTSSSDLIF